MSDEPTKKSLIGGVLVDAGIITAQQLEEALVFQKNTNARQTELLGKALVKLGFCSDEEIAVAIAKSSGARFITLKETTPGSNVQGILPPEIVQKYKAVPFMFEDDKLIIILENPYNIKALEDIKLMTGRELITAIVPDSELEYLINQYINSSTKMKDMDQFDAEEEKSDVLESNDDVEKPVMQLANQIISLGVRSNASDIHIEAQEKRSRIRFRVDGVLHEFMKIPSNMHSSLISRIKVMAGMDITQTRIPQDGRISIKVDERIIDIRVATLPSTFGEKVTCRLIDRSSKLISLSEIGFMDHKLAQFDTVSQLPYGFILITGPTGSGKSTTLYATLAKLNVVEKNIITVEDPIEKKIEGLNQVQVNSRAGMTFSSVLRSILRSDPDTIMIGEIRDHETAKIAVESALTGHLVLSTLHTNDSSGAITRLDDMGIEPFLTSSSLIAVVAQRLIRKLCTKCKEPISIHKDELINLIPDFPFDENVDTYNLYKAKGCIQCNNTGFKGRIGVYELLVISENLRKLILKRSSTAEIKKQAVDEGMETLRMEGLIKVKQGITSAEEVLRVII